MFRRIEYFQPSVIVRVFLSCTLFIFLKNHILVLLIFAIVSFISFSFISDLIFMILLLTFGFFCSSFSNCFRCKLGCLFEMFLVSWGRIVLLQTSLLELLLLHQIGFGSLCFHCPLFLGNFDFLFDFFSELLVI